MPQEAQPSLNEQEFLLKALAENVRLDGRAFDQYRELKLSFGPQFGQADLRIGKTRVLVRISAEVTKPFPDRQFEGIFSITTDLGPMGSVAFEAGRLSEREIILSRVLEKAIRRSGALDTESLCIVSGKKVWTIRADIHLLDYDGGLIDASCIAVLAALQHFRRPDFRVDDASEGTITLFSLNERVPIPLSILHHPICITFSLFNNGQTALVDATLLEELVSECSLVVTVNKQGEVCQIAKHGGVAVDARALLACTQVAVTRGREIIEFIDQSLKTHLQQSASLLKVDLSAENER